MRRTREDNDLAELLKAITVDADGEDEQLRAIAGAIARGLKLPVDAFVVGEPVELVAIEYAGSPRVGIQAVCRRGEMKEAAKTFTRMLWLNPPDNQGARFNLANVEAGRAWEECEEHAG